MIILEILYDDRYHQGSKDWVAECDGCGAALDLVQTFRKANDSAHSMGWVWRDRPFEDGRELMCSACISVERKLVSHA